MRLLVSIANYYGAQRDKFLKRIIKEYRKLDFSTDIVVYSDGIRKLQGARVIKGRYTGTDFTWCGRQEMIALAMANEYDLFIHTDDDVLIRQETILAFLEETRRLPELFIPSFTISEEYPYRSGVWYALNHHRKWTTADKLLSINNRRYYIPRNRHWAGLMATQFHLRKAIRSGKFCTEPTARLDLGMRAQEWAMSNLYFRNECGMLPVIPIDNLHTFKAEHLDRRYAHSGNFLTLDEVRERALQLPLQTVT